MGEAGGHRQEVENDTDMPAQNGQVLIDLLGLRVGDPRIIQRLEIVKAMAEVAKFFFADGIGYERSVLLGFCVAGGEDIPTLRSNV